MYIREAKAPALVFERELFMVDAQKVEQGCLEVVNVYRVLCDIVAEVVRFAVGNSRLDAAAGHPYGETSRVMITTVVFRRELSLGIAGPAKLAAPYHQRIIQQPTLLQVDDQCC